MQYITLHLEEFHGIRPMRNINSTCTGRQRKHEFINISISRKQDGICETQMSPIMAKSKDGLGHKDKYLDTSRKILLMCNMKALIFIIYK